MVQTIIVKANGLNFEVDEVSSFDGSNEKLALLLHGFPENKFSWRFQLNLLAGLGYRVWAPNMRGYGRTSRPKGVAQYTVERLLDDVAGLIDASGAKEVTLIGHDWGGIVAWCFAIRKVRPLSRLVVMNLPHPAAFTARLTWQQRIRSFYIAFFQLPLVPEWLLTRDNARLVAKAFYDMAVDKSRFTADVLDYYRDCALQPGAINAMVNYYRGLRLSPMKYDSSPDVMPIEVPTLMLWGEQDTALGVETTYGTDRYVKDLTVRYLPDVSHWVQQEAPEAVNAMLQAWLENRSVPEANELEENFVQLPHIPAPGEFPALPNQ